MKPDDPATDPTLTPEQADPATAHTETPREVTACARPSLPPAGYQLGELLGKGGMGEVVLARDRRIDREVAIKRLRVADPSPAAVARFLREAKIQARLDHPAILPVHELGEDADGRPYFTMRRLTGMTGAEALTHQDVPLQRMLRAFVDVCLAIEFAHSRKVVHRDLKPSNVLIGDFGEVYVIDWGVARVVDDLESDIATLDPEAPRGEGTEAGVLLGTPGYMAPEQIRGEPVGPAADVYALGAILFEILTREPLHVRGLGGLAATLANPTRSPAQLRPDLAPELDEACTAALAAQPADRPTARALADRVQRYLDGDRDLERRKQIAAEELASAQAALANGDRVEALRTAGRALALDPKSKIAAQLVSSLVLEPPRELPPDLQRHLAEVDLVFIRQQWRVVALTWIAFFLVVPFALWSGIEEPLPVYGLLAVVCSQVVLGLHWSRGGTPRAWVALVGSALAMCLLSRMFGPFILVAGGLTVSTSGLLSYPTLTHRPVLVMGTCAGAFMLTIALELSGVIGQAWSVTEGSLVINEAAISLGGSSTVVFLVVSNVLLILAGGFLARGIANTRLAAQHQVEIQAWHLRKLIPTAT